MIKDFSPRLYQETILATAAEKNTLVVLPTGLGKTFIFMMLALQRLQKHPDKKILFLGPTRPLITQYYNLFLKHTKINEEEMNIFTGLVKPEKRELLWKSSKIIFSTPQGLENDVISNRIKLNEVSLVGFDEAHRATGDYSYVWVAKQYMKNSQDPKIVALTASPGTDIEKITEVCKNLYIEDVEIRTDQDPDVKPYIKEVDIKWINVELNSYFKRIQNYLNDCYNSKITEIKQYAPNAILENKTHLLAFQGSLMGEVGRGNKDIDILKSMSKTAEAMKVQHAIELLESQGINPLLEYLEDLNAKAVTSKVKAVQNLVRDLNFKSALILTRNLKKAGIQHPKVIELKKILTNLVENPDKKIIVFSQYRDSISYLVEEINKIEGAKAEMFVGQAKKKGRGLSQKEQIKLIDEFRDNKFNVLVMSSVGEEGLDIPSVDTVIFYEPVPSAVRTIQRRGRTGRQDKGEVIVLVTKDTRDEGYRWSSHHKEKRMHRILNDLKKKFSPKQIENKTISEFVVPDNGIVIYADYREKGSGIIKKLIDLGIEIELKKLDIGDYLLSDKLVVEYKTVPDFVDSLIDKRLLTQLKDMKNYYKQLIIIEGEEDIYSQRRLHPNAIRGMLATISIDYKIPILTTRTPIETALLMATIAKREQTDEDKNFTMHSSKPQTIKEQQEYLVSALPGVGPVLSSPLLKEFKTVKKIMNASVDELKKVDLIGDIKAKKIREIIDSEYIFKK